MDKEKKRRGPYLKWTVTDTMEVDSEQIFVEPLQDILPPKIPNTTDIKKETQSTSFMPGVCPSECVREIYQPDIIGLEENGPTGEWLFREKQIKDPDLDELFEDIKKDMAEGEPDVDNEETPLSVLNDHISETLIVDHLHSEGPEVVTPKSNPVDHSEKPIYPGSKRLLGVTMLLLCTFMTRFQVSDEMMAGMLSIIELLLPQGCIVTTSLYGIKKYLQNFVSLPKIRHYCSNCYIHVDAGQIKCTNELCAKDLTLSGSKDYFVQHSLISQLRVMFLRKDFTDKIRSHRFSHYKNNIDNALRDIYDGTNYKELFDNGVLSNPDNVSFSMNTDGVPIFKSSGVSMWPVYLLVNELPIQDRKSRENVLFFGIWISANKPMMWSFLKPLHDELKLLGNGVNSTNCRRETFTCKACLISSICDLPAKCLLTNSMQFNGAHSCWYCLQEGETFHTQKGGHTHVFPFLAKDSSGPPRTYENLKHDVSAAVKKLKDNNYKQVQAVCGIKGPNWFMFLPHFNVIHGFVIDYMHGVCLGVMKTLLNLWFHKDHKHEKFSCHKFSKQVDSDLKCIKPNLDITRIPRALSDLVHWKASEFRNFLLYWGLPVMYGLLSTENYLHFSLLVKAMHILLSDHVTKHEMATARDCLLEFVSNFQDIYSLRYMTMNMHQLLHLVDNVRANGPLFANNLFVFEDLNGFIKKNIHGTQAVDKQVIKTISIIQAIPVLKEKFLVPDSEEEALYTSMTMFSYQNWTKINETYTVIGRMSNTALTDVENKAVSLEYSLDNSLKSFKRVFLKSKHCLLFANSYTRMFRRDQSIIKYSKNGEQRFGSITSFISFEDSNGCSIAGAFIKPFNVLGDSTYISKNKIHRVVPKTSQTCFVIFEDIVSLCMLIHCQSADRYYICEHPNRKDSD